MENTDRMAYEPVPHWAHEKDMARMERGNKRVWVLVVLLVVALVGTNAYWIWSESQYEDASTSYEVEQDAENGTNNFAGGDMNGAPEN